jgi:hypothetical protein
MTSSSSWDPVMESLEQEEVVLRHRVENPPVEDSIPRFISGFHTDVVSQQFNFHHYVESEIAVLDSVRRKGTVSPETLAKRWYIGTEIARRTIEGTT